MLQASPDATCLVLDCPGISFIDTQGSAKMRELVGIGEAAGAEVRLAGLKPVVRELLTRDGVADLIGAERIHGNVHRAVEAHLAATSEDHPG
jgi:hypothetical protein